MLNWLRIVFFSAIALGAGLLITLAAGGSNSADFERYFPVLLVINIFATLTLFAFVVAVTYRMVKRFKKGVFGSKMTASLALMMSAKRSSIPMVELLLWADASASGALNPRARG